MQAKEKPVLVIASQKGGVGKTATAAALIDCFRAQGLRVLGVDCDPQGNLSNVQKDYIVDGCASTDELFFGKPIAVRADGQAHHSHTVCHPQDDVRRPVRRCRDAVPLYDGVSNRARRPGIHGHAHGRS